MTQRQSMTQRITQAADRLFYQKGIRAVGVDAVALEAGISKRSLYDTFASKDALVAAYLRQRSRPLRVSDHPPVGQVLALFDQLHLRFTEDGFRGCPFVNAVTELAEDCATARTIAREHKTERRQHIIDLLRQAGIDRPEALAAQIAILYDGAIALMLVQGDPEVALQARDAAAVLLGAGPTDADTEDQPPVRQHVQEHDV